MKEKEESSRHVRFTEPQSGYNGGYRGRHSGNGCSGQNRKETSVDVQQTGAVPEMLQSVKGTVMPVVKGRVGDKEVINVLRDAGWSYAVIRKELLRTIGKRLVKSRDVC